MQAKDKIPSSKECSTATSRGFLMFPLPFTHVFKYPNTEISVWYAPPVQPFDLGNDSSSGCNDDFSHQGKGS